MSLAAGGNISYILDRSTVLFAPKSDIVITTKEGEVHIKSGAVALIFEDGQAVSVLDMSDREPGAVTFVTSCYIIALVPGQQVVLTRNLSTTFNDINPASSVACRNVEKVPLNNGVVAYISEFSIVSALNTAHLYRQLAQMHPPVAFNKIMKTAASIQFVKASQPAYSVKP